MKSSMALGRIFLFVAVLTAAMPVWAQASGDPTLGEELEPLLALALRLGPEVAEQALEAEAAEARAAVAGSLPDPTLRVTSDEIDRIEGGRQNKWVYSLEQEVPLWGKRDLRAGMARAEVDAARSRGRAAGAELIERVKAAFADHYRAAAALKVTADLHRVVHGLAEAAEVRYAQGRGTQAEIFAARAAAAHLAQDTARLEAERDIARSRLNLLVGRPADAPLLTPRTLRLPPEIVDMAGLVERMRRDNPVLAALDAEAEGTARGRRLADKTWYPDVVVGVAALDRGRNGPGGYTASIGVKVPLQADLHGGEVREASARHGAARARRALMERELATELAETRAGFAGAVRRMRVVEEQLLAQARGAVEAMRAGYALNRADLGAVLEAEHAVGEARLELLDLENEAQRALARIERLIGGEL